MNRQQTALRNLYIEIRHRLTSAPPSTVTVDDEDTDAKEHKRAEEAWSACGLDEIGRCWRDAVTTGRSARDVFTPSGWLTLRGGK